MPHLNLKRIILPIMGLLLVTVVACGGAEPTDPPATVPPTRPPATPMPTPAVPEYTVAGFVLDSSNNPLLGGQVTLEPSGRSATTSTADGSYQIPNVPDGVYKVSVTPRCVAYGCYTTAVLVVDGSDIPEFNLAPVPASVLPGGPRAARSVLQGSIALGQVEFPGDNLELLSPNDLQPGESAQLILAAPECFRCSQLVAVDAEVAWSVDPDDGASIGQESGLLTVNADTPVDAIYTVTADVGAGQHALSVEIRVYSAEDDPLVGVWRESGTGNVNQLLLTSGGEFAVTANPFGNYQDYWGTYTFDPSTGFIEFTATGANQAAPESWGTGSFVLDPDGTLALDGICFGRWDDDAKSLAKNCGHEFVR